MFWYRRLLTAFSRRESRCVALVDCPSAEQLVAAAQSEKRKKEVVFPGEKGRASAGKDDVTPDHMGPSMWQCRFPCCLACIYLLLAAASILWQPTKNVF